jgi:hypothetical protein
MLAGIASAGVAVMTYLSGSRSTAQRHRDTPAEAAPASPARNTQSPPAAPRAQDPGDRTPAQKK